MNEAIPDSQELFDLLDYFEATYEVSDEYIPGGVIPQDELDSIEEEVFDEEE